MDNSREKSIYKVTIVGTITNLLLVLFKFIAGIVGHSAAMVADAVHSLSDFVTDIIVLIFIRISGKPADEDHSYGHGKYETLATLIIGLILFGVGVGIIVSGVEKMVAVMQGAILQTPKGVALIAAAVSIVAKEALYQYTIHKAKLINSQTVIANAWHHRSDAFSSIGVFAGIGGAMLFGQQWTILDPLAAVVVSGFIIKVAIDLAKPCLEELLERSLPAEVEKEIESIILSVNGVSSPHHLRTRRIGNNYAIEVHIRMDGNISLNQAHQITTTVEQLLKSRYGSGTHVGIHTEPIKTA